MQCEHEVAWLSFPVVAKSSVAAPQRARAPSAEVYPKAKHKQTKAAGLEAAAGAHALVSAWLSGQDVEDAVENWSPWRYPH